MALSLVLPAVIVLSLFNVVGAWPPNPLSLVTCTGEFARCSNSNPLDRRCSMLHHRCLYQTCNASSSSNRPLYLCPSDSKCRPNFSDCGPFPTGNSNVSFWNWTLPRKDRVRALSKATTLDEQIKQLTNTAPAIARLYVPEYEWLNDDLHGLRRHRATSFPNGCGLGPTWNPETLKKAGDIVGTEARATHHHFVQEGNRGEIGYNNGMGLTIYGPNINLVRDPRWGRAQEVYGEDPCLGAAMAKGIVDGIQTEKDGVLKAAACCKHFAVYDLESDPIARYFYDAKVDGRNLWESYLVVFEACVRDAKAAHVMCSYNAVNGVPACAQKPLLDGVLRQKWNFTGFVVSDYDAWAQIYETHKYCPNMTCAASTGINAGLDQEGGGTAAIDKLSAAVDLGAVTPERIAESFERLFDVRLRLGMFDPPEQTPFTDVHYKEISSGKHLQASLDTARETVCLYKNANKTLPLSETFSAEGSKIAVIGPNAAATYWLQGNYAEPPYWGCVSLLEGVFSQVCPSPPMQLDASGFSYVPDYQDWFVNATTVADCQSLCQADLSCNYFSYFPDKQACYFMPTTEFRRKQNSSAAVQSGARRGQSIWYYGVSFVPRNISEIPFDDDASGWANGEEEEQSSRDATSSPPAKVIIVVRSQDARECSQRCRAESQCGAFTFNVVGSKCVLIHRSAAHPPSHQIPSLVDISGVTPPKCPHVTFSPACADGMRCQKPSFFDEAVAAAAAADAVVLVLGLDQQIEAEGMDRTTIDLPPNQYRLASLVRNGTSSSSGRRRPLIGAFVHGGTFALHDLKDELDAMLDLWYPSQFGGTAFAEALFGKINPGGHSTVTYYKSNEDLPPTLAYQSFYPNASAGLKGYTYRYFNGTPEIAFGHGLSYTTFEFGNMSVSKHPDLLGSASSLTPSFNLSCDPLVVHVDITNTGAVLGDEVVQVYIEQNPTNASSSRNSEAEADETAPVPNIRLGAFKRVKDLRPGERRSLRLAVPPRYHATIVEVDKSDPILGTKTMLVAGRLRISVGAGQPKFTDGVRQAIVDLEGASVDYDQCGGQV